MLPGVRDWRKVDEVLLQRACRREVDVLIKGRQKRILMVMNCSVSWLWWWIHEPAPVIMLYTHTHTQRSTNKAGEKTPGSSLEPLSWLWHWTVLQDITVARYYKISYSFARYYQWRKMDERYTALFTSTCKSIAIAIKIFIKNVLKMQQQNL